MYSVKEAAEILGLSLQGVRWYEEKGYLPCERGGNGYRRFSREDLTRAQQIRAYAAMGFTMDEAREVTNDMDADGIRRALERCGRDIEDKMAALERQREQIGYALRTLEACEGSREPYVQATDGMYYLPLERDFALPDTREKRLTEKEWLLAWPDVRIARMLYDAAGNACDSKGMITFLSKVRSRGLTVPEGAFFRPAGKFWTEPVICPLGDEGTLRAVRGRALQAGYEQDGPLIAAVETTFTRDGVRYGVYNVGMHLKM